MKLHIHIYGLGLIGGSLAKAIKASEAAHIIKASDREEVLQTALEENVIDGKLISIEESSEADIIFLCMPAELSLDYLAKLAPIIKSGGILSDVCGVKGCFSKKWKTLKSKGEYLGGHPMTGKESAGYENSDRLLFENAVYILSDEKINSPLHEDFISVIRSTGGRIKFLSPDIHDKIIAYVSHLPQILAVALVNLIPSDDYLDFAAGGFRDMTRIASSEYKMWESILKLNSFEISAALNNFQSLLKSIEISSLSANFDDARKRRDEIPKNTKGFISSLYDLYIFVKDKPGILSEITTALYQNNINIKDIELLKIREGSGGTFRLSFQSESEKTSAKKVMENLGYRTA